MARVGETIENPVTGERVTWVETAASSGGALLAFDLTTRPGGAVAAAHVHRLQEERFSVHRGSIGLEIAGRTRLAVVGDQVAVQARVAHRWWNAGEADAVARVELRPALDTETFFETLFGLARDGRTNARGIPGVLQVAMLYTHHREGSPFLAGPPVAVQRAVMSVLAPLGRLCARRAVYRTYSPGHPAGGPGP